MEEEKPTKKTGVTNRAAIKRLSLDFARATRYWKPTRVSDRFLDRMEAYLIMKIKGDIRKHPSRGKTIT